jgi:hypothetical protein
LVKNSQAKLPSCAGTMVAASLLPSGAVAYKLSAVSVAVFHRAREVHLRTEGHAHVAAAPPGRA